MNRKARRQGYKPGSPPRKESDDIITITGDDLINGMFEEAENMSAKEIAVAWECSEPYVQEALKKLLSKKTASMAERRKAIEEWDNDRTKLGKN